MMILLNEPFCAAITFVLHDPHVVRNSEETYDFLARSYRVAKLLALNVASLVGILVSIAALNVQISESWTRTTVRLYAIVLGALALLLLLGLPLLFTVMLYPRLVNSFLFLQEQGNSPGCRRRGARGTGIHRCHNGHPKFQRPSEGICQNADSRQ
jgi:hypothetical protein